MPYTLSDTPPSLDDYLRLRLESGLHPKTPAQAEGALANSWSFCRAVTEAGETVAMGRAAGGQAESYRKPASDRFGDTEPARHLRYGPRGEDHLRSE